MEDSFSRLDRPVEIAMVLYTRIVLNVTLLLLT
jgi:hypothetical protein